VVNNLEVTNNLDIEPDVRCRVLMTSTMESMTSLVTESHRLENGRASRRETMAPAAFVRSASAPVDASSAAWRRDRTCGSRKGRTAIARMAKRMRFPMRVSL
jgi:hypothetical protein